MSSIPRGSTDLESAPLLINEDAPPGPVPAASASSGEREDRRTGFLAQLTDPQRALTAVEKLLFVIAFLFLILAATFIGLFAAERNKKHDAPPQPPPYPIPTWTSSATATASITSTVSTPAPTSTSSVCLTPACVQLSASILGSLDTSADPCEDFYQYASGGWVKQNPLPKDKGRYGSFNQLAKANERILEDILSAPLPDLPKDPSTEEIAGRDNLVKLQTEFGSCMNVSRLDALGVQPLAPLLENVQRLFPADYPTPKEESQASDGVFAALELAAEEAIERVKATLALLRADRPSPAAGALETLDDAEDGNVEAVSRKGSRFRKELTDALAFIHSIGVDAVFSFELEGDAAIEPQRQILWLSQNGLGLPSKEYYLEASVTEVYEKVLAEVLEEVFKLTHGSKAVGGDDDAQVQWEWPHLPWNPAPAPDDRGKKPPKSSSARALAKQAAASVLAFEQRLAKVQADPEYLQDPTYSYNPMSFAKLAKRLPIDLAAYVSSFAPRNFPDKIVVTSPEYLKKMTRIVEQEEDYVLQSYLLARVAMKFARNLGDTKIRQSTERLSTLLTGVKVQPDRTDFCVQQTRKTLDHLAGAEFVARAFGGSSKVSGEAMVNSILAAFRETLGHLPWMDKESSKAAQRKADNVIAKVGYPLYPNTTSSVALRAYYGRQAVTDDFLLNAVASNQMELQRAWQQQLGNLRNRDSWLMAADEVNAYANPPDSEIVFPAGILQPPFFSASWPSVLNYGAMGAVAAHEIGHLYDSTGAQYDYEGRFRRWWSNETVAAFKERTECISKQYSKFYVIGPDGERVYVNGRLTSGEDAGDAGLRVAWKAWKDSLTAEGHSKQQLKLPGLAEYSDEQLFFLAFGRIWASTSTPASAKAGVLTDPHSPNQFRVEGTLRNFETFASVWQCKEGARMNPPSEERCALW